MAVRRFRIIMSQCHSSQEQDNNAIFIVRPIPCRISNAGPRRFNSGHRSPHLRRIGHVEVSYLFHCIPSLSVKMPYGMQLISSLVSSMHPQSLSYD
jgi:hypothetical protein